MNLFSPDTLKQLCRACGLRPSPRYGQNFLIDSEIAAKILAAAGLTRSDTVVEVGPGFGTLTLALAPRVKRVAAFEIEKRLESYWEKIQWEHPNLEVVWGNVLREFNSNEGKRLKVKGERYKVVANLPYQITAAVIRMFLESELQPSLMVLMVQKEVGERLCAAPGEMSFLSVMVQYYAEPEMVCRVPRTSFWPVPAVDSAVITLKVKGERGKVPAIGGSAFGGKGEKADERPERAFFFRLVKAGFAQRRKLLIKNLAGVGDKTALKRVWVELGLSPTARAQEISLSTWQELARRLPD